MGITEYQRGGVKSVDASRVYIYPKCSLLEGSIE